MVKNRVLILVCGGTIIMKENAEGALLPPGEDEALGLLLQIEPKLQTIADFEVTYIANKDSTNMVPSDWDKLLEAICARYKDFDGFVITHGTDTMAYTAAALSLGLQGLGKPVVLTGSQIPGWLINSDARRNMVNALKLAVMDLRGVYILFDERIIPGCRATKSSESKLDAFRTVNAPDAGEIRIKIQLHPNTPRRMKGELILNKGFAPDIFTCSLTPGCDPQDLEFLLENDRIRGIIIEAFGTGNLPDNFDNFFRKARDKRTPVIITSQCLHGITHMSSYAVGKRALDLGAIEGYDQSLEILTVKLMWGVHHFDYAEIAGIIGCNFGGELRLTGN